MKAEIAIRDYERAVARLQLLLKFFRGDQAQETLGKIQIGVHRDLVDFGIKDAVQAIADLIRQDMPGYFGRAIAAAQADVRAAAARVQSAIDGDLNSNIMKG